MFREQGRIGQPTGPIKEHVHGASTSLRQGYGGPPKRFSAKAEDPALLYRDLALCSEPAKAPIACQYISGFTSVQIVVVAPWDGDERFPRRRRTVEDTLAGRVGNDRIGVAVDHEQRPLVSLDERRGRKPVPKRTRSAAA